MTKTERSVTRQMNVILEGLPKVFLDETTFLFRLEWLRNMSLTSLRNPDNPDTNSNRSFTVGAYTLPTTDGLPVHLSVGRLWFIQCSRRVDFKDLGFRIL